MCVSQYQISISIVYVNVMTETTVGYDDITTVIKTIIFSKSVAHGYQINIKMVTYS